jgi:hypothetical protein
VKRFDVGSTNKAADRGRKADPINSPERRSWFAAAVQGELIGRD